LEGKAFIALGIAFLGGKAARSPCKPADYNMQLTSPFKGVDNAQYLLHHRGCRGGFGYPVFLVLIALGDHSDPHPLHCLKPHPDCCITKGYAGPES
jgi:hypothetical protein